MKITTKRTKTGATISIKAETEQDKRRLTEAVVSGRLFEPMKKAGTKKAAKKG